MHATYCSPTIWILILTKIHLCMDQNNSMPFNRYAFLTTHNSFAIKREEAGTEAIHITFTNQEDSITQQLNGPALDTLKEIEAFMSSNPSEIVTLILEDHVETPNALTRVLKEAGLMTYWFPLSSMPKKGQDWPLVKDMVAKNQRLIVFTSMEHKQQTEGIAYQWNFMVENQYGNHGMEPGRCPNRNESAPMNDHSKSLILVNHFRTIPLRLMACKDNSEELIEMLHTCHAAADNRWANFVAVDYYKRSDGGGVFKAIDTLNGDLLCGCADVHACKVQQILDLRLLCIHLL
ncbi:hypothetical protein Cgig2_021725 [Carnegiea gigantea]|uniref:Uncharacterized protein n=1 Tax=Carnegiea gigantea TaxID=171969 RepID=A0A9Q1JT21_9CARY|nr:hypothetical protein Cgig2_014125 [Carnegiea gigantea]KAJ8430479.1 hypothetical protein Cgig2_021725 [Carnegiea gigantea]